MKTLYLECLMGAAGDMLMGALLELYEDKKGFLDAMNGLFPEVTVEAEAVKRQGISGTHMRVIIGGREEGNHEQGHEHSHRSLPEITALIDAFPLPEEVRTNAKNVYTQIAEAEAHAHGCPAGEVHFHEVGTLDAIADVTGVCYLMYLLAPDMVCASPVTVGSGTVSTAHGLLPVPAPATAHLLNGIPVSTGEIAAELCTPTGAALLKAFARHFGAMPPGTVLGCGYGCGTKDFPQANCLRAFLLETADHAGGPNDTVTELKANIDDMSGEALGFAMERLLDAGALDVSYVPLQMKKNRPGVLLLCLCRTADADRLAKEILVYTGTFGVRRTDCARYALDVRKETVETEFGPVDCKTGTGYGVVKRKAEYEDAARAARNCGETLETVQKGVL
ncbi:MAG: nickel pincer cofactor biosynthesis protein LarC [Oscillospiraceae bacterium]|nr:nickel pincer cofactor biosynthesis protein LarC [Oscillospiraceae bacterium]